MKARLKALILASEFLKKTGLYRVTTLRKGCELLYLLCAYDAYEKIRLGQHNVWINVIDRGVGMPLVLWRDYDSYEISLLRDSLRSGDVLYDVGANIGIYSLFASDVIGPSGKIIAFEPDPRCLNLLRLNLEENQVQNATVFDIGLTDRDGTMDLSMDGVNWGKNTIFTSNIPEGDIVGSVSIRIARLDTLVDEHKLPLPNVIKIDVEGAEDLCLRGAEHILSMDRDLVLFVEVWPWGMRNLGGKIREFFDFLLEKGFTIRNINSANKRLEPLDLEKFSKLNLRAAQANIMAVKRKGG